MKPGDYPLRLIRLALLAALWVGPTAFAQDPGQAPTAVRKVAPSLPKPVVFQGTGTRGGGEGCDQDFKSFVQDAAEWLKIEAPQIREKIDLKAFKTDLLDRSVNCIDGPVALDDLTRAAVSDRASRVINVSFPRWDTYSDLRKARIVLHEGLVLQGIEKTEDYHISGEMRSDERARFAGNSLIPENHTIRVFLLIIHKAIESVSRTGTDNLRPEFPAAFELRLLDQSDHLLLRYEGTGSYGSANLMGARLEFPAPVQAEFVGLAKVTLFGRKLLFRLQATATGGVIEREGHFVFQHPEPGILLEPAQQIQSWLFLRQGCYPILEATRISPSSQIKASTGSSGPLDGLSETPLSTASAESTLGCTLQQDEAGKIRLRFRDSHISLKLRVTIQYSFNLLPFFGCLSACSYDSPADLSNSWLDPK